MVIKRNQIIVTALVIMVAVAGYLNLQENKIAKTVKVDDSDITGVLVPNDGGILASSGTDLVEGEIGIAMNSLQDEDMAGSPGADQEVLAQQAEPVGNINKEQTGQAVFVKNQEASFFIQAKLDREQARAKRKDMLMEMIENKNLEKDQKSQCADEILDLQKRIEKETSAEAMIEAKGFNEAYVRIDDDTIDVVVNKENLTEAEIAQIEDIVKRKTGFAADKIRISPLKK